MTAASAIRIALPAHEPMLRRRSRAAAAPSCPSSDDEIRDAWRLLAESEGIVAELSSAAGLAALIAGSRRQRAAGGVRSDRPRPQGPGDLTRRRDPSSRSRSRLDPRGGPMSAPTHIHVRAPATTANIGPGFDCAGAALDLWNELELRPGNGPVDREHLGVRAFERDRSRRRLELRVHGQDPAGAWPRLERIGDRPRTRRCGDRRRAGADGRRAARARDRAGGARRQSRRGARRRRLPDLGDADRPDRGHAPATPIAVDPGGARPDRRVASRAARARCPTPTRRSPPAGQRFSAPHSRSSSADLFEAALEDRLHEPYRANGAPLLGQLRAKLPAGGAGRHPLRRRPDCDRLGTATARQTPAPNELRSRFPNEQVLPLTISQTGAGPT